MYQPTSASLAHPPFPHFRTASPFITRYLSLSPTPLDPTLTSHPSEPSAAMGLAPALEPIPNHVCVCAVPALRNSKAERYRQYTRPLLVDTRFSPSWCVRDKDRTGRERELTERKRGIGTDEWNEASVREEEAVESYSELNN